MRLAFNEKLRKRSGDNHDIITINFNDQPINIDFSDEFLTMKTYQGEIILSQGESSPNIIAYKAGVPFSNSDYFCNVYIFAESDMSECLFEDQCILVEDVYSYQIKSETTKPLDPGFYNVIIQLRSYQNDENKLCRIPMRIKESLYDFE